VNGCDDRFEEIVVMFRHRETRSTHELPVGYNQGYFNLGRADVNR
jgi:hypothetical protein